MSEVQTTPEFGRRLMYLLSRGYRGGETDCEYFIDCRHPKADPIIVRWNGETTRNVSDHAPADFEGFKRWVGDVEHPKPLIDWALVLLWAPGILAGFSIWLNW